MSLAQFQTTQSAAPALTQVSAVQRQAAPTSNGLAEGLNAATSLISGIGATAMKATALGATAAKTAATDSIVNQFDADLTKLQEAAATTPGFDLQSAQKKMVQRYAKDHPDYSTAFTDQFYKHTGQRAGALSFAQKEAQEMQAKAWEAGYGYAGADPVYNQDQQNLFVSMQREATEWAHRTKQIDINLKEGAYSDDQARRATLEAATPLTQSYFDKTKSDAMQIQKRLEAGELTQAEAQLQFQMMKSDFNMAMNKLGRYVSDPAVQAQMSPITDLMTVLNDFISGKTEAAAINQQITLQTARGKQLLLEADPTLTIDLAQSEMFQHSPVQLAHLSSKIVAASSKASASFVGVTGEDAKGIRNTIESAYSGSNATPQSKMEAIKATESWIVGTERNYDDYSAEDFKHLFTVLDNKALVSSMSPEMATRLENITARYFADHSDKFLREITESGTLKSASTTMGLTYGYGGTPATPTNRNVPLSQWAEIKVTDQGVSYKIKPEFSKDVEANRRVMELNKKASAFSPMVRTAVGAGMSPEEIGANFFGVVTEEGTPGTPTTPSKAEDAPSRADAFSGEGNPSQKPVDSLSLDVEDNEARTKAFTQFKEQGLSHIQVKGMLEAMGLLDNAGIANAYKEFLGE